MTTRNRIGAGIFGLGAALFLWLGLRLLSPCGGGCAAGPSMLAAPAFGLMTLHAVLALGVLGDRAWARWMGIGVGFAWVLATSLVACTASPAIWLFAALHAPLPLLLARPDGVHGRTSISLLLTGMALPLALTLGLGELARFSVSWVNLLATGIVAVGAIGLARDRTWGLLLCGLAGVTFLAGGLLDPVAMERPLFEISGLVALPLMAALVPFARPMARWLRA
ncbi:MAG: hypothetical protein H6719_35390 [Sandaracinaceae bacterium]|nr:hypothetical protein [Sandaracinaceae bacterium]